MSITTCETDAKRSMIVARLIGRERGGEKKKKKKRAVDNKKRVKSIYRRPYADGGGRKGERAREREGGGRKKIKK